MLAAFDSGVMYMGQVSSPVTYSPNIHHLPRCTAANVSDCKLFCIQCAAPTVILVPSENKLSYTLASSLYRCKCFRLQVYNHYLPRCTAENVSDCKPIPLHSSLYRRKCFILQAILQPMCCSDSPFGIIYIYFIII
ncbi:hypothetical protein AVEN_228448-1 [Araneus ventricosus]|uniref:Uncharacterized protein n=1 Tax=Araneus ventricosus TaxID=182803 RepID=A0A4Y2E3X7_ARAVE|nr:hypothetical protein AVEN_228448-1 [Araneus ventricosus]